VTPNRRLARLPARPSLRSQPKRPQTSSHRTDTHRTSHRRHGVTSHKSSGHPQKPTDAIILRRQPTYYLNSAVSDRCYPRLERLSSKLTPCCRLTFFCCVGRRRCSHSSSFVRSPHRSSFASLQRKLFLCLLFTRFRTFVSCFLY
jgi:hypothetical protein